MLGSQTLSTSGIFAETFTSKLGTDSIVIVNLIVNPTYNNTDTKQICFGSNYQFGTQTLTSSGTYSHIFQSVKGCDSTVVLTLTVKPQLTSTINVSICNGEAYMFGGLDLWTEGTYYRTVSGSTGCDSTTTLYLTVNDTYNDTIFATINKGESYSFNGSSYSESGLFTVTLNTLNGCDSIINLILTVNELAVDIPQGFSPNGDGVNDNFVIDGILNYPGNTLEIYNRWGNLVYKTADYQNNWDGTSTGSMTIGNTPLPPGTYFYLLNLGDYSKVSTGYIYLTR